MLAENATNQDASIVKNRIQALASEDSKMLKKIEETRKQADRMKQTRQINEEKLEQMQLLEKIRSTEMMEKQIKVLEERKHRAFHTEMKVR